MISTGEIITTSDDKKYYCFDSILDDNINYLYLCLLEDQTKIFFAKQIADEIQLLSKKDEKLHVLNLFKNKLAN